MLAPRRAAPTAKAMGSSLLLPLLLRLLLWPLVGGRNSSLGLLQYLCTSGLGLLRLLCGEFLREKVLFRGIHLDQLKHATETREGLLPRLDSESTRHQVASGLLYLPVQWPVSASVPCLMC